MEVPTQTVCANSECGHPLKDHIDVPVTTLKQIKHEVHPCLYVERDNTSFAVCACTDFILPVPQAVPEPVIPPEVVDSMIVAGVRLLFVKGGAVRWEPLK
jgi:hypothetical protein